MTTRSKTRVTRSRWTEASELAPEVEVGGEIASTSDTTPLGRIAAQMAKQVIFQKVREAERDTVFNEYAHRINEVLNATVKRIEGQDIIFDLGKTEARMPRASSPRLEQFAVGERVRVVFSGGQRRQGPAGDRLARRARAGPNLFQTEVPEIYDGTVVIRAIAREAGERTKIAVMSPRQGRGPRRRLRRHEGHARAVHHPRAARRKNRHHRVFRRDHHLCREGSAAGQGHARLHHGPAEKQLEVIVDDTQLSLAIGKKGQNVRLAAKLLGWKIDIKSEEEKRQEVEQQMQAHAGRTHRPPSSRSPELGDGVMEKLITAGITTVEPLADMTPEELEDPRHRREDRGEDHRRRPPLLRPARGPSAPSPAEKRPDHHSEAALGSAKKRSPLVPHQMLLETRSIP